MDESRKLSKEREERQSRVDTTLPTLPDKNTTESRLPYSFKIRKSVYDVATYYRALSKITWGVFVERALIQYMDVNPVDGLVLFVENPKTDEEQDIDDWMGELVCKQELREIITKIERRTKPSAPLHKNFIRELQKILKECKRIKNRSEELNTLIETVRGYFAE